MKESSNEKLLDKEPVCQCYYSLIGEQQFNHLMSH